MWKCSSTFTCFTFGCLRPHTSCFGLESFVIIGACHWFAHLRLQRNRVRARNAKGKQGETVYMFRFCYAHIFTCLHFVWRARIKFLCTRSWANQWHPPMRMKHARPEKNMRTQPPKGEQGESGLKLPPYTFTLFTFRCLNSILFGLVRQA